MAQAMKEKSIESVTTGQSLLDVLVIGAGPAGLAAAVAACERGAANVIVLDREQYAGGVLPQCVHDGFGLHIHGSSLTGPEYARAWEAHARDAGAHLVLGATVLSVKHKPDGPFLIDAVGVALKGRVVLKARTVVVATGCRERTRGQLGIPGTRPAGVFTAGEAQYMVNVKNQLPGDKVVILGSGDIGLIMARRLTLEGAQVRLVLGQEATGLLRNHLRCIQDFGIPLRNGWGISSIHGAGQLKGVSVAPLLDDGTFDVAQHEYIRCNTLLLACGLIPEREVLSGLDAGENDGLFVCGNAQAPRDLADQVTQEGLRAGSAAAEFALNASGKGTPRLLSHETTRVLNVKVSEPKGKMSDVVGAKAVDGERVLACTVCPTGCVMQVSSGGDVNGNGCARGLDYAHDELTCPKRLFTGTVRIQGAQGPLVSVRTAAEVPLDSLASVAGKAAHLRVQAPVYAGDVLCDNIADTGVALVATTDVATAPLGRS